MAEANIICHSGVAFVVVTGSTVVDKGNLNASADLDVPIIAPRRRIVSLALHGLFDCDGFFFNYHHFLCLSIIGCKKHTATSCNC